MADFSSFFKGQYSIGELLNIDMARQQKSQNCSVNLVKIFHELKEESLLDKFKAFFLGKSVIKGYYVIFKLEVTSDSGKKHIVLIRTEPDFNLSIYNNNKVKIYCDCDDFKYRAAYGLNKRNSLLLTSRTSSQLGPAITQPPRKQSITLLCKHAYAALGWLFQNYQSVMRTI